MRTAALLSGLCALCTFAACAARSVDEERDAFSSPEAAIPEIRRMLRDEDWPALARYYDLSGSRVERAELQSGNFFLVRDTTAVAQPSEVTRYRHPFPPAADLAAIHETRDPGVVAVQMVVSIDQGEGAPVQRAVSWFKMRESRGGWRILPDPVTPAEQTGPRLR